MCAGVAALVCGLSLGAFHLGYAFSAYQTLADNVQNAATTASRMQFDPRNPDAFSSAVQNLVVYGSTRPKHNRIVDDLSPANVRVSWTKDASGKPVMVTVSVSGASAGALLRAFLFSRRPEATVAYAG